MGITNRDIQQRMKELQGLGKNIPERLMAAQNSATEYAVTVAQDTTPPTKDSGIRGTGTISGDLKEHWATDSQTESKRKGRRYETILANNLNYASWVNDGHRMDKHFVPGLIFNPGSGLLERVDPSQGGIMVGTKTQHVPGLHMKEKAREAYREQLYRQLGKILEEK